MVDVGVSFGNEAYSRQIKSTRARFDTLVDFVKAASGLRGITRSGLTHLEVLAEDLEGGRGGSSWGGNLVQSFVITRNWGSFHNLPQCNTNYENEAR